MNKRTLHRLLSWLRHVKTWQLVIMLMIGVVLSASFLRLNNLEMMTLRDAVIEADKQGDTTLIQKRLTQLQHFVSAHMNASLGNGLYLEHKYNRDREAALATAAGATNPNAEVYKQASVECRARFRYTQASYTDDYVMCVVERVRSLGAGEDPAAGVNLPKPEWYHYNFVSPMWSPDIAGFTVLICAVMASVIVLRLISLLVLRLLLKHRFKSV